MHFIEIFLRREIELPEKPNLIGHKFNQSTEGYRFRRFGLRKGKLSFNRTQYNTGV